jgi:hypothetical protein
MTPDATPGSEWGGTAVEGSGLTIRIVGGGEPSPVEEAALTIAVRQVLAERDRRRSERSPLWGTVGRIEARGGPTVRSRAVLPRDVPRDVPGDVGRPA